MPRPLRKRLTYANVVSTLALFVTLGTGTAYATHLVVNSSDVVNESLVSQDLKDGAAVRSNDIVNGQVASSDVTDGTIASGDVRDQSLTGIDIGNDTLDGADIRNLSWADMLGDTLTGGQINESTLGQVPAATLGGLGRSLKGGSCDPESSTYLDCGYVRMNLPAAAQILLIARATAYTEPDASNGVGTCRLVSSSGALHATEVFISMNGIDEQEHVPMSTVTGMVFPAGQHDFGMECNQGGVGAIHYGYVWVTALAISPS